MSRHTITLGASTTAGGTVISASSNGSINGQRIALEGDAINCPACRSQGKIVCAGSRVQELWNGKSVALEDDLCICGCPIPPKLIARQTLRFQTLANAHANELGSTRPSDVTQQTATVSQEFDDRFVLTNEDTGRPLRLREYAIRRADGTIEFGETDENGHTHLLTSTTASEPVEFFL